MEESLANSSKGKWPEKALEDGIETGAWMGTAGMARLCVAKIFFNNISHQQLITFIQDEVIEEAFEC